MENGHFKFIPPDPAKRIVVASGTPSDHRGWQNFIAEMRRQGFQLDH